jgi:DNA adenine methylase
MYSNKLYAPLRYPGGKARFAPLIAEIIRRNGLSGAHYLEPYAGGAGVALELLLHEHVAEIHINDADPAVYDFWIAATRHSKDLVELVKTSPVDMTAWFHWRDVLTRRLAASDVERGFATLFMNRTNRSGILKGGVIGGKEQRGQYKLDARFKRDVLIKRLETIERYAHRINVYGQDAMRLLRGCASFLPPKSLVYLDPPYYVKGQELYRNYYAHDDHVAIAQLLQSKAFAWPWVVSYDNVAEIRVMYEMARSLAYGLGYTAQRRYSGAEVMFFSSNLKEVPPDAPIAAAA